jgi:hypothetical protein
MVGKEGPLASSDTAMLLDAVLSGRATLREAASVQSVALDDAAATPATDG